MVRFESFFSLTAVQLISTSTIKNSFNMNCHCVVLFKCILYLFTTHKNFFSHSLWFIKLKLLVFHIGFKLPLRMRNCWLTIDTTSERQCNKKLATSFHASLCRVIQYRFVITVATGWSQLEVKEINFRNIWWYISHRNRS